MIQNFLYCFNRTIDEYLTDPLQNAAGRMGLFRIIYSLFYLWVLTDYVPAYLAHLPASMVHKVDILQVFPDQLPIEFFEVLIAVLSAALVFLLAGFRTYIATGVVLFSGFLLESFHISSGFEHGSIFLMLISRSSCSSLETGELHGQSTQSGHKG